MYTLHCETTTMAWAYGLRNLILPGNAIAIAGMPYDHARNTAVAMCLRDGYEYLFSLDSDVIPPRDAILRLLARNLPVVSGLYARRSPPHAIPVAIKNGSWLTDYKPGSLVEVDLVGAGCLLVHRSVFEQVPPQDPAAPWFMWRVNERDFASERISSERPSLSEDFCWNHHIKKYGIKTWLDTSVVCRHVGAAQSLPGQFVPLETCTLT